MEKGKHTGYGQNSRMGNVHPSQRVILSTLPTIANREGRQHSLFFLKLFFFCNVDHLKTLY